MVSHLENQDMADAAVVAARATANLGRMSGRTTKLNVSEKGRRYTFAVVPKNIGNPFFDFVRDGCYDKSRRLSANLGEQDSIKCLFVGPEDGSDANGQASIVKELIQGRINGTAIKGISVEEGGSGRIDGIALSAISASVAGEALARAEREGIPTVTFDSDVETPPSLQQHLRRAYIGTDNLAFGEALGKLLLQLAPEGGTYGILADKAPNIELRMKGVRQHLASTKWVEIGEGGVSPVYCQDSIEIALDVMHELAAYPYNSMGRTGNADLPRDGRVDAIIPVGGWPMYNDTGWMEFVDAHRPPLKLVVGDTLDMQVRLFNRDYVDGLVGQVPYQMGEFCIETLLKINQNKSIEDIITGTTLLEMLRFPLDLPAPDKNNNYIGSLAILAYILFAVVAALSLFFAGWTAVHHRKKVRVVIAAQPLFLYLIVGGVLVFGSSLVPLTIDDDRYSQRAADIACMTIPWLICLGFTTTFAALFSKVWRLNKIFKSAKRMRKVTVRPWHVLGPCAVLLTVNVVILACWTALAPLKYQREYRAGTDTWNRKTDSYGHCDSIGDKSSYPYAGSLAGVNFAVIVLANIQAYQARNIHTEFSESHYIGVLMVGILQAVLVAVPVMFLAKDYPKQIFVVLSVLIFGVSVSVLVLLFVPKMLYLKRQREADKEKKERERERERQLCNYQAGGQQETGAFGQHMDDGEGDERRKVSGTNMLKQSSSMASIQLEDSIAGDLAFSSEDSSDNGSADDGAYFIATRVSSQKIAWRAIHHSIKKQELRRRHNARNATELSRTAPIRKNTSEETEGTKVGNGGTGGTSLGNLRGKFNRIQSEWVLSKTELDFIHEDMHKEGEEMAGKNGHKISWKKNYSDDALSKNDRNFVAGDLIRDEDEEKGGSINGVGELFNNT